MRGKTAPKRCTNKTLPLWDAGALVVPAPAVVRCTSRITMPATRFRQRQYVSTQLPNYP